MGAIDPTARVEYEALVSSSIRDGLRRQIVEKMRWSIQRAYLSGCLSGRLTHICFVIVESSAVLGVCLSDQARGSDRFEPRAYPWQLDQALQADQRALDLPTLALLPDLEQDGVLRGLSWVVWDGSRPDWAATLAHVVLEGAERILEVAALHCYRRRCRIHVVSGQRRWDCQLGAERRLVQQHQDEGDARSGRSARAGRGYASETIAQVLAAVDDGSAVCEVCRRFGIGEATYYRWRHAYHGLNALGIQRVRELEQENASLRRQLERG